jgi:hypothetical protein
MTHKSIDDFENGEDEKRIEEESNHFPLVEVL